MTFNLPRMTLVVILIAVTIFLGNGIFQLWNARDFVRLFFTGSLGLGTLTLGVLAFRRLK